MTLILADVSEFQGVINWAAYGAANPAVIVRVHNSYRPDNYAKANIAGARAHTQWRAFYQYLTAGADPVKAAHDFQATTGPLLPGEVAILDFEEGTGDQRPRRQAWLDALHDPVEWTYSGLYFARQHLMGIHIQWLAAYGQSEPSDAHDLWQFTDAQRFAGITNPCDGSTFHGTLAQLQALTNTPEVDMPITQADADLIVHSLLVTNLGSSGPNVAVALQHASALANVNVAAVAAAVVAAIPTGGVAITQAQLEAALRTVLGSVDGTP